MEFYRWRNIFVILIMMTVLSSGFLFVMKGSKIIFASQTAAISNTTSPSNQNAVSLSPPPQKLANPPAIIKAIYVTGYSAGSKTYLNYLTNLFKTTQVNAVVVDIKGSDGQTGLYDANSFVNFLHSQNIYVIGRIAVFEDPVFAKANPEWAVYNTQKTPSANSGQATNKTKPILWQDDNKLNWMDPASKDVWNYNISLAKDALNNHGFDEINFDYARFPTDGVANEMGFPVWDQKTPMADVIKSFFEYTRSQLAGQKISVDLFGLTTVSKDDMGIGQIIENAFENFDYVAPMVYPSHFANGFIGFANPAEHPYNVIKYSMSSAQNKENIFAQSVALQITLAKFRPWLQDFNMGAVYNAAMVDQEIQATEDSLGTNYSGFMLWNPSNIYTQDAILK